jgi:hypothetical protein
VGAAALQRERYAPFLKRPVGILIMDPLLHFHILRGCLSQRQLVG